MGIESESITQAIEQYLSDLIEQANESVVKLRRKDIAARFGCVPSQINYVLRSRFAPEQGYLVESQRGGHGYIKIVRMHFKDVDDKLNYFSDLIGISLTEQQSRKLLVNFQNREMISARERLIIEVALRNQDETCRTLFDVSPYKRDYMRAELLKKMLVSITLQ